MDALILSCATGGGHHAAAEAIREALVHRGHHVDMLDPYTLSGKKMDEKVGNCYISCAQKAPTLFGTIYQLGNLCRRLPVKSPVYWVNGIVADAMAKYLEEHSCDIILTTHLFPGEILTHLKRRGIALPKIVFVATDYTCIPFTEEIDCDFFLVPAGTELEFSRRGIPEQKVIPMGIPVRREFREETGRDRAVERLGLPVDRRYILLAGGSIGAGKIVQAVRPLHRYLREHRDTTLIVVCGSNRKLYEELEKRYREERQILLLKKTECMAEYMKACDFYLSKPGGISSTEAAVANVPLIHISPIPGCETKNERFFSGHGMSLYVADLEKGLLSAIEQLKDAETVKRMKAAQREFVDPDSAEKTVDFIYTFVIDTEHGKTIR